MAPRPLAWAIAGRFVFATAACGDTEVEPIAVSPPSPPSQEAAKTRPCKPRESGWGSFLPKPRCSTKSAPRRSAQSRREAKAKRLVEAQVGEKVKCWDGGAVNTRLRPEYPVMYFCSNKDDNIYTAVVSADGVLMSLSGPRT